MGSSIARRVAQSLRRQGLWGSVQQARTIAEDYWFDMTCGVDTSSWAWLDDLSIDSDNKERGYAYMPCRVRPLRKLLRAIRPMIPADDVLVDFGSGKGRVLLVSSQFGFSEVRGVEFAHELCEVARKNVAAFRGKSGAGTEYRIVECDAAKYVVNPDEGVFFFNNPFDHTVMNEVLSSIATSLRERWRRVLIVYHNPTCGDTIEKRNDFVKLRDIRFWGHTFALYSNRDSGSGQCQKDAAM